MNTAISILKHDFWQNYLIYLVYWWYATLSINVLKSHLFQVFVDNFTEQGRLATEKVLYDIVILHFPDGHPSALHPNPVPATSSPGITSKASQKTPTDRSSSETTTIRFYKIIVHLHHQKTKRVIIERNPINTLTQTAVNVWVGSQRCSYWCPVAKVPSHQYPQCCLNSNCIGTITYRNMTFTGDWRHKIKLNFVKEK